MLFASDTSPETRRILLEIIRGQSPERRLEIALAATDVARDLVRADLAARFPDADASRLHALFLERWLGHDLARKVLEWAEHGPGTPERQA
jgi:hypothetical protein